MSFCPLISTFPSNLARIWGWFRTLQLQVVSRSCSIIFFVLEQDLSIYLSFHFSFSFDFTLWSAGTATCTNRQVTFFLCLFAAIAYYVIGRFVYITTKPTLAILLGHIYFCFERVLIALFFAAITIDSSFL